ncbi:MAG: hypothetical protein NXH85_13850 [Pseudomonadaceae bacterium]|nr:hypothetical protein [Pseudomonadaceae bacterium]
MTTKIDELISSPNEPMTDLLVSLLPRLHGGKNHQLNANPEARNRALLESIIQQVSNAQLPLDSVAQSLGILLATSQAHGEVADSVVIDAGWGIQFLAELSSALEHVRSDAQSLLDNPPKVREVAA